MIKFKNDTHWQCSCFFAGSTKGYTDGNGTNAQFNVPWGITIDKNNNIFVSVQQ